MSQNATGASPAGTPRSRSPRRVREDAESPREVNSAPRRPLRGSSAAAPSPDRAGGNRLRKSPTEPVGGETTLLLQSSAGASIPERGGAPAARVADPHEAAAAPVDGWPGAGDPVAAHEGSPSQDDEIDAARGGDRSSDRTYDREAAHSSMQVSDLLRQSPLNASGGRERLAGRIAELGRGELDRGDRERVARVLAREDATAEEVRDGISTALMDAFRKQTGRGVFGLLYELNAGHLLVQVSGRLRRYGSKADPGDVLQEVFFNVYRYPHRFDASREDAFRVWTAMIVRNTVLKHMRSRSTGGGRQEVAFEDLSDQPVADGVTPLGGVLEGEASAQAARAYLTYLQLYIEFYSMLSDRERRALHLVEVEGVSYREAAADLGIKLENLKMVIFRARRKIHRAMRRVFDGLTPDCRPARVGTVSQPCAREARSRSGAPGASRTARKRELTSDPETSDS